MTLASRLAAALLVLASASGCAAEKVAALEGVSAPAARRPSAPPPLRVAVISDLNGSYGRAEYDRSVHAAVERLLETSPDLVLSTGDMVAGQRDGLDYAGMWASFHAAVSDRLLGASIPFAVTPGNHDASGYARYAGERSLYVEQWSARRPDVDMVDDSLYPLRYSFRRGGALFVSLDATTVGPLDDAQMRWLEGQLAASTEAVKIIFGHVPLHPFTHGRERESLGDPRLEEMLLRHEVDLFVSGHHHAYYPGRRGALRLVSTACLGSGARPLIGTDTPSPKSLLSFEITADGIQNLEGWTGPTFEQRVDRASLPMSVGVGERRIHRDDVELPSRAPLLVHRDHVHDEPSHDPSYEGRQALAQRKPEPALSQPR